jgi:hypothetical protein
LIVVKKLLKTDDMVRLSFFKERESRVMTRATTGSTRLKFAIGALLTSAAFAPAFAQTPAPAPAAAPASLEGSDGRLRQGLLPALRRLPRRAAQGRDGQES